MLANINKHAIPTYGNPRNNGLHHFYSTYPSFFIPQTLRLQVPFLLYLCIYTNIYTNTEEMAPVILSVKLSITQSQFYEMSLESCNSSYCYVFWQKGQIQNWIHCEGNFWNYHISPSKYIYFMLHIYSECSGSGNNTVELHCNRVNRYRI